MQQKAEHYICWCLWKCSASALVFIPIIVLVCQSLQMSPLCTHMGPLCYTSWIYYTENGSLWRKREEVRSGGHRRSYLTLHQCVIVAAAAAGRHDWMSPVAEVCGGGETQRKWGEPWQGWGEERGELMWEEERGKRESEAQHWNHQQMIKNKRYNRFST